MDPSEGSGGGWSEADSRHFIEVGRIHTPAQAEIGETILELIPAARDEPFLAVELGVGGGWLSEAILTHFPASRVVGLDGSPTMLRETGARLRPFGDRFARGRSGLRIDPGWRTWAPPRAASSAHS